MLEVKDAIYSPMDSRSVHDPKLYDIMLTDITEADNRNLDTELGTLRLSAVAEFQPNAYPI